MPGPRERHARSKDGSGDWTAVPSRRQARDAAAADQEGTAVTEEEALDAAVAQLDLAGVADAALSLAEHLAHVLNSAEAMDRVNALQRRREVTR